MTGRVAQELLTLIGEAAFIRLAESFGGTRLYVPTRLPDDHEIIRAVGPKAAALLVERLAPDTIRVPLARETLARHYRAEGQSNAQIARALRITETGVDKLFQRLPDAPLKGSNQLDLFA